MEINLVSSEEQENVLVDEEGFSEKADLSASSGPMFKKAIRWLVYASVFLVPLLFLPFTADVAEFNKQVVLIAAAGIGLFLFLVDVIKSGIVSYKPSRFYLPVFGLVAAGIVSVIFSVNRFNSLFGIGEARSWSLMSLVSLAVLFFLAVNVIEDRGKELKKIMIASLSLAFLFGILQAFGIFLFKGANFASRGFNSVGALNTLGILAAVSLAFFGSGRGKENGILDYIRYVGLAFALLIVVLINWWPIWTVAFVSLLASVAFTSAGNSALLKSGRMRLFAIPMAVIVLGVFLMLINFNWSSIKSKLPVEVSPTQKVSWGIAVDSLKSRPLGFGGDNFAVAYDKYKPASIANSIFYQVRFNDAASEAVNLSIEGGILMMLAFLLLLWVYGKGLMAKIKNGFDGGETSAVWAAGFGLFAAFFLYPFSMSLIATLFFVLVLTVLSHEQEEKTINLEEDTKYSFAGSIAFIVGLVLVMVAGYFTVNNYAANVYLAKAANASDRGKAIEYYVESINSNNKDARVYRLLSQEVLAKLADDLKSGPQKDESRENYNARIQNQIASAVNIALSATNIDSANSQNWINRGIIYQNLMSLVGGADQAAINTFTESLVRNPANPVAYLRIGNVYLTLAENMAKSSSPKSQIEENLLKAEDNFKKAIALNNNYGQALLNLAVVYDRQNKIPEAIKQFEKLVSANPRDPSLVFQLGLLYYRNNQKDNALKAWQQAVFLFPNYSNARWYLSLIFEERGELEKALEQIREIEKFNPTNELVIQRIEKLESGQRTIPPEKLLDQEPLNQ